MSFCPPPAASRRTPSAPVPAVAGDPQTAGVAFRGAWHVAGAEASALELTLRALRPLLTNPDITEVCINRPGEAYVETRAGWRCEPLPFATYEWCLSLAKLVANFTRPAHRCRITFIVGITPEWRAHPDRAAAGDERGNGGHHHPPAGR